MSGSHALAVERTLDAPRDAVWRAFTDHIAEWWCPRPWSTEIVALDWRSGGRFALTMKDENGQAYPGDGMLLEVVPAERMVFTNLLGAGWTPQVPQPIGIVGMFELADAGAGRTRYRASALHRNEEDRQTHAAMGFDRGWGAVAGQLEEVARRVAAG